MHTRNVGDEFVSVILDVLQTGWNAGQMEAARRAWVAHSIVLRLRRFAKDLRDFWVGCVVPSANSQIIKLVRYSMIASPYCCAWGTLICGEASKCFCGL